MIDAKGEDMEKVEDATEEAAAGAPLEPRSCGNCSACCTVIGVRTIDKAPLTRCPNVAAQGGCAIYPTRPVACAAFACLWLAVPAFGTQRHRPDRLGLLFDQNVGDDVAAKLGLPADAKILVAREVRPNAAQDRRAARVIAQLRRDGVNVVVVGWNRNPTVHLASRQEPLADSNEAPKTT